MGEVTQRVSVGVHGPRSRGTSTQPGLSAHGRYVTFAADAVNLVPDDTNEASDIFVFDRVTSETQRVSVGHAGVCRCPGIAPIREFRPTGGM